MKRILFVFVLICLLLSACSSKPPRHPLNICKIFSQYPSWYWGAKHARTKWHVPISVQMAIIYEESHYLADAKPPHKKLLGFIPWFRPTSAAGYMQAIDQTWRLYLHETEKRSADRSNFSDATDFIGWFVHRTHVKLGLSTKNAYAIYLAYHEGIEGYRQKSYLHKLWLIHVARKVQRYASRYRLQLLRCEGHLPIKPWWRFW